MVMIRISGVFFVMVLATKMTLFVADDSKLIEIESLASLEKRIAHLIDEALRHREEEAEREEEGRRLGFAHRWVGIKRAIVRRMPGRGPTSGPAAASRVAAFVRTLGVSLRGVLAVRVMPWHLDGSHHSEPDKNIGLQGFVGLAF